MRQLQVIWDKQAISAADLTWEQFPKPGNVFVNSVFIPNDLWQIPCFFAHCEIPNSLIHISFTLILISVPPHISRGPESIIAYITHNVTLPCDAIGLPTPMVMWDKGGRPLSYGRRTRFHKLDHGSLLITDVREMDAGDYYCLVVNQAGSDTMKIHLKVKGQCSRTLQKSCQIQNLYVLHNTIWIFSQLCVCKGSKLTWILQKSLVACQLIITAVY